METGTRSLEAKSLNSPDETRPFAAKGKADVVKLGGVTVGRASLSPVGGGRSTSSLSLVPRVVRHRMSATSSPAGCT